MSTGQNLRTPATYHRWTDLPFVCLSTVALSPCVVPPPLLESTSATTLGGGAPSLPDSQRQDREGSRLAKQPRASFLIFDAHLPAFCVLRRTLDLLLRSFWCDGVFPPFCRCQRHLCNLCMFSGEVRSRQATNDKKSRNQMARISVAPYRL